jgi:hypothetical protein
MALAGTMEPNGEIVRGQTQCSRDLVRWQGFEKGIFQPLHGWSECGGFEAGKVTSTALFGVMESEPVR